MDDQYEGMTNQDVDPVDEFEEERTATLFLDAEQDAREAREEQDQAAEYGTLPEDPDDEEDEDEDGMDEGEMA